MSVSKVCRRRFFLLLLGVLAAAPAFAQTTFEPSVGQAGKDVIWVPTPDALVETMLDMANVTPQDFLMDLGSGDGRTVIAAARRGLKAMGVEYNPDMVIVSKEAAARAGVEDRATFVQADLFETDLTRAQVITMFLLPSINMKLRPTILNLKPGTRIVSNTFRMEDWAPDRTESIDDCTGYCTALLWIVPARVQGTWKTAQGNLVLTQQFQMLTGTLGGAPVEGRMNGDAITLTAGGTTYTGRVNARLNAISGPNFNATKLD